MMGICYGHIVAEENLENNKQKRSTRFECERGRFVCEKIRFVYDVEAK